MVAFEDAVAVAAGAANAADGALVDLTARALADRLWEGWKIHTPRQWLCLRTGVSRQRADQVLRVARRAGELPTTVGLLREGRLSLDQAATVARYSPAAYEASVCEMAIAATVSQIVAATRRYAFDADAAEGAEGREGERPIERSVAFGSDGGQWWGRVRLPADEGLVVEAALQRSRDRLNAEAKAARREPGADPAPGEPSVGWADALVGMAHSALHGDVAGAGSTARIAVWVHLDAPDGDGTRWRAELHGDRPLPPSVRRLLTCDAASAPVWHRDGHPVQVGRTRRDVPDRVRRLVEHRDGHRCRVPGCDQTLWLQIHHVVHWEDGGPTDTANLASLCGGHHRQHHQGLLGITGDADLPPGTAGALTFTDARGNPLFAGRPHPPRRCAAGPVRRYQAPTGEPLRSRDVQFAPTSAPPTRPPEPVLRR